MIALAAALTVTLSPAQKQATDALFLAIPAVEQAWPGYKFLGKPFLAVLEDDSALLVGHPSPPADFAAARRKKREVYVAAKGPDIGFTFKMSFKLGGESVMAVRAAKDQSPEDLMALAVHERFHDFQDGQNFTPGHARYSVEAAEDLALAALENRALAKWLEGDAEAIRDFGAVRSRRRADFPGSHAETLEENNEGTARFIEQAALSAMVDDARAKDFLLRDLRRPIRLDDMAKARLYPVGATLCRYLQTKATGAWQSKVAAGQRLSELAVETLALTQKESDARVGRLTSGAEYAAMLAHGQEQVKKVQERRKQTQDKFDAQTGVKVRLELSTAQRSKSYFSASNSVSYPDGSKIYDPIGTYVGSGFKLEGIMVRSERNGSLEFYVDGSAWTPAQGTEDFKTLKIEGKGVALDLPAGTVDYDGKRAKIVTK